MMIGDSFKEIKNVKLNAMKKSKKERKANKFQDLGQNQRTEGTKIKTKRRRRKGTDQNHLNPLKRSVIIKNLPRIENIDWEV